MSVARAHFLQSLGGISDAIALEIVAQGAGAVNVPASVVVLRRGILIAGLIALETFVRDRTEEALGALARWPRSYDELPEKLRLAARLNALSHLQQFAKVLKRQGDDYETELSIELVKMASGASGVFQFTKYVAGDYTGNLSDQGLKEILASLQVNDCWTSFRSFASEAGLGVPSVHELVKNTVRKRHRSAHSARYFPTASDISELPSDLLCIAMCYDVAVTASMELALSEPQEWSAGQTAWREAVQLWLARPHPNGMSVRKQGASRAHRIVDDISAVRAAIPRAAVGFVNVLVEQDGAARPVAWGIL